jgi:hypothetical protein
MKNSTIEDIFTKVHKTFLSDLFYIHLFSLQLCHKMKIEARNDTRKKTLCDLYANSFTPPHRTALCCGSHE